RETEDQSEARHRLELQKAEADAAERRVRERLEAEWARPFEQLLASAPSLEESELRRRKKDGEESDGDESAELQSEFAESAGNDDDIPEMSAERIGTGYKACKSEPLALTTDTDRSG